MKVFYECLAIMWFSVLMMMCFFFTILILFSYYYLASCLSDKTIVNKILSSFLMTCSQIIVTELLLGLTGYLYLLSLIAINVAMSSLVIIYCYKQSKIALVVTIKQDYAITKETLYAAMDMYNMSLLVLVTLSYSWVIIAAYFLPLRGVDDLFYHLPPIFEYIQTHTIKLLPINIRPHFAFPQNAELLFLWPSIFSHSQKMLDCVNVPFVLASIVVVYSLLRHFLIPKKDAIFAGLLYALCPVVIMQAGSNYIDIIVAFFFLLSLYYTVLYFQCQRLSYVWLAGVSIGIVCGMKYTAFFLTIPLQLIILWTMFTNKRSHLAGYLTIVLTLCGWWYLRNLVVLDNPFYPMNLLLPGMGQNGGGGESITSNFYLNVSNWMLQFPLDDVGIGSYDGGFGLVFWGLGFSSWLYLFVYSILNLKAVDFAKFIVLIQLPIGFLMLLFAQQKDVQFDGRLSLFVVAIGLLAFSLVYKMLHTIFYESALKMICIVFSALTVCLMFTSTMPSYRLGNTFLAGTDSELPSEFRFSMNTNAIFFKLKNIWYPLDYLTKDDIPGVSCYIASNNEYLALSPFYGSNLQNRPVAIGSNVPSKVDAFVYLHYPVRDIFGFISTQNICYPKSKFTKEKMLSSAGYAVITHSDLGCLIMSKAYLYNPDKLKMLRIYYGETWPDDVAAAEKLKSYLQPGVPVVTSNSLAYGLRYWELDNGKMDSILLVPSGFEEHVAKTHHLMNCYTLDKPLNGYAFKEVATVQLNLKPVRIYLNYVKRQA